MHWWWLEIEALLRIRAGKGIVLKLGVSSHGMLVLRKGETPCAYQCKSVAYASSQLSVLGVLLLGGLYPRM